MEKIIFIIILSIFIKQSNLLKQLKSLTSSEYEEDNMISKNIVRSMDHSDIEKAKSKAKLVRSIKSNYSFGSAQAVPKARYGGRDRYALDPILNQVRRKNQDTLLKKLVNQRRFIVVPEDQSNQSTSSSSTEMKDWKDEWQEIWHQKQLQALNQTKPGGDTVNMAAARPWGVQCGDPNQHDMPWGTCMLAVECEPEFRVYRGDYFCGRTAFVCCALQISTYDLYQGFDVSFDKSTWEEDSEERKRNKKEWKIKKKKKRNQNLRRKQLRKKRKKKIIRTIKKVLKEMRNILNRQYRNGTRFKKRRTKQLQKFVKALKRKYIADRNSVKDIHEMELMKVDYKLLERLEQIIKMNKQFISNATYRDIIVNGTISKQVARTLVKQFPELRPYFHFSTPLRRRRNARRNIEVSESGSEIEENVRPARRKIKTSESNSKDEAEDDTARKSIGHEHKAGYDIEYGMLYY